MPVSARSRISGRMPRVAASSRSDASHSEKGGGRGGTGAIGAIGGSSCATDAAPDTRTKSSAVASRGIRHSSRAISRISGSWIILLGREVMNQLDLQQRVAVITGGARGIGHATARRALQSGAVVSLWDVDGQKAESA